MKKLFLITMAIASFSLVACGENKPEPGPTPPPGPIYTTYDVTWDLNNGTKPIVETYIEGEMPYCDYTPAYKWVDNITICYFKGWNKKIVPVTEDITYTAVYEEPIRVATVVTLIGLLPENDTFTFSYEGELAAVDWGEGGTLDKSGATTHKYTFPEGKSISVVIKIYGKLTSFALSDASGTRLDKANLAVQSIVLAETIEKVPDSAFANIYYADSIFIDNNVKYVGKNAIKKVASGASIYLQSGLHEEVLESGWNPSNRHVVKNVSKVVATFDEEAKVYYSAIDVDINHVQYLALSAFYPYDKEQTQFETLTLPTTINGEDVDAIVYSPFRDIDYHFNKIIFPEKIVYLGEDGFSYTNVDEIEIPASIEVIGKDAFANITATKITFTGDNPRLESIGANAFSYATKLKEIINLPSSITTLSDSVFASSTQLEKIDGFGNTKITNIPAYTFNACFELNNLELPATIQTIKGFSFSSTRKLSEIDASAFTSENIPTCEERSFISLPSTVNVKVNSSFESGDAARKAFVEKGWLESFNYTIAG